MRRFTGIFLTICIACSCLMMYQAPSCNVGGDASILACPMATISTPTLMTVVQHDAVLPTTTTLLVIAGFFLAFLKATVPPKRINGAKWRYRRRFLHAILPKYGPQNQIGHHSFISPERAP